MQQSITQILCTLRLHVVLIMALSLTISDIFLTYCLYLTWKDLEQCFKCRKAVNILGQTKKSVHFNTVEAIGNICIIFWDEKHQYSKSAPGLWAVTWLSVD